MNKLKFVKSVIEKYELIFADSPLGICITEIDGNVTMNNTFCEMLGYTKEKLLKSGWKDITFKDDITKHQETFDSYTAENNNTKTFETRLIKKDGSIIWTEVTSKLKYCEGSNPAYIISMIRDITKYKNAQEKLKQNKLRYKELFENNPSPMWLYDIKTLKFLMVNNAAVEHYGYTEDEFLKMTINDIRLSEDAPKLMQYFAPIDSTINDSETWRHRKKDGAIILVKISVHSINYNGFTARVVMAIDVTEKVTAKQNLVIEVAKLKSIIESTSDAVFSLDKNYCYTSFNTTHALLMKNLYNADIEIGKNILNFQTVDDDRNKAKINIDKALNGQQVREVSISGEETLTQRYFEILHNPIKNESGEVIGVSVFAKDITETKLALMQLEKSEKEFHSLFTEDLTGDFITTPEGKIILCNPRFLSIFGFKSEDEAYNTPADLLYKNPFNRSIIIERIKNGRKIENLEIELIRCDGKIINVLENVVGQFDSNGKLEKIIGYIIDITEQKIAFKKVKQLSKAVEQSPVSIMITDTEGNIQYINPKGLELTGYRIDELLNNNPRIFSSGEMTKEDYQLLWNTIKSGEKWNGEFHNKKKNGVLYWEQASISPIKNEKGEITNFLAVKEDITERKNSVLELIAAKEKAEEINRIKSIFFSNMSHELRTPMVAILGFADILLSTIKDESSKLMAESILHAGKRLLNTLTSLLNLAELETLKGNIELMDIDVNLLCNELLSIQRLNSNKSNIQFITEFEEESLKINCNFRMLRESLIHLLNNAETFTEEGFILLKTYKNIVPESGAKLGIIEVIDTGIGIPTEKLNVVFEEFRQASEGFTRNYEGIGLGLTLTKKYVELMGGTIDVVSAQDTGTKFTLSFPIIEKIEIKELKPKDDKTLKPVKELKNSFHNKKILIVEDDEMNKLFLKQCFANTCNFEIASTGEQAVKLSSENKFNLILMDINLGRGINGITAVQIIKQLDGYEKIPFVAMTAYASNESKREFLSKGFSHFISKPFVMKDMIALVSGIFSEKSVIINTDIS